MPDMIGRVLVAFFAVVGITELFRLFLFWLTSSKRKDKLTVVLCFQGYDDQAEHRLRSTLERLRWMRHAGEKEILCVDCGMDMETKAVCEAFARVHSIIQLCSADQLVETLCAEFANT